MKNMEQKIRKPEVSVIPATKHLTGAGGQIRKRSSLRVAAYCRVSTEDESQQTSYATQKAFYTRMIAGHAGWTLAGIYADEAISGTSRAKRKDFNRMISDAQNGRMDYIVTKSISRFARNTVDTLDCVRQLRQLNPPVGIYFEKENIDTLDAAGELLLTILSALAQDESRSISDNIRWAIQKKFQRGEVIVNLDRMLGYNRGQDGEWLINPDQAETVRYIFQRYVSGISASAIARELNRMDKKTVRGCVWRADAVLLILRNEKYVGDCESQKTITKNFLTHKATVNHGEAPKYYVRDHHVSIIDRLTWNKVQAMLSESPPENRKGGEMIKRRGPKNSVFFNLVCGKSGCSGKFSRLGYHATLNSYTDSRSAAAEGIDPAGFRERYYYYYPVWRCIRSQSDRNSKQKECGMGTLYEIALEQSFMEMLYHLKHDHNANGKDSRLSRLFQEAISPIGKNREKQYPYDTEQYPDMIETQIKRLEGKLSQILKKQMNALRHVGRMKTEMMLRDILTEESEENEMAIYDKLADDLRMQIKKLKREKTLLEAEQNAANALQKNFDFFLECLQALPEKNAAGQKLTINGEAESEQPPDFLHFEKGIYKAFIRSGTVRGDAVEYTTSFGVKLTSYGNRRTLGSFRGFRRANLDGTIEILEENWKINGRGVRYVRKPVSKK